MSQNEKNYTIVSMRKIFQHPVRLNMKQLITSFAFAFLSISCGNEHPPLVKAVDKPKADKRFDIGISPKTVMLDLSLSRKANVAVKLSISNKGKEPRTFNKFYDCWQPILTTDSGESIKLSYARDATRSPSVDDFPLIASGKTKTIEFRINSFSSEKGHTILIWDTTGGAFSAPISAGKYKIAIDYNSQKDARISEVSDGKFGFTFRDLVEGKARSNVIELVVKE